MAFIWPTKMAARVGERRLAPLGRCGAVQFNFSDTVRNHPDTSGFKVFSPNDIIIVKKNKRFIIVVVVLLLLF